MKRIFKRICTLLISVATIPFMGFLPVSATENQNIAYITENQTRVEPDQDLQSFAENIGLNLVCFEETKEIGNYLRSSSDHKMYCKTVSNYFLTDEQLARLGQVSNQQQYIFTYAATAYAALHYDTYKNGTVDYGKLTYASGGVRNIDTGWQITQQTVTFGTFGSYDGHPYTDQTYGPVTYTDVTWNENMPSNWAHVNMAAFHDIGLSNKITAKHGTAVYTAQFKASV